jgi:lipoprotein-anchoring transpeptidase ErfK/SrfK
MMKKKFYFCLLLLAISYWLLAIGSARAADAYILENQLINGQTSVSGPAEYIRIFFIFGLGLIGIVALFAIIFGGIRYMSSGGSETGKAEGKKWIFASLSGVILLFSSYLILNTINPDLVSLKDPHLEAITIPRTIDNYIPSEVGYQKPVTGQISSSIQNLSQYQGQLNPSNSQIIIDKSDHAMYVYKDGQLIAQAPVGIGINDKNGTQAGGVSGDKITPTGNFIITNDIRYNANGVYSGQFGSNMGPAFIGLSCADQNGNYRGIGIHGSANSTLGSTFGCIRLQNADLIILYNSVRSGIPIQIRN